MILTTRATARIVQQYIRTSAMGFVSSARMAAPVQRTDATSVLIQPIGNVLIILATLFAFVRPLLLR